MPPYATYTPSGPEYLHSLPAPNTPLTPHNSPQHPYETPMPPHATYTPSGPWVPTLPASPNKPLTPPYIPLMAQHALHSLWDP